MSYRVITHNGKSHMDEVLAIVLLSIYKKELPHEIVRVHPERAASMVQGGEIGNDTYYIDCGKDFNRDKNLFDHHQSKELGCAALLIFETYFQELYGSKLHDYILLVSEVDTKGPNALDDFNKSSKSITYFGFTQKLVLREFENDAIGVIKIYRDGILGMLEFEEQRKQAKLWLEKDNNISIISVNNINILVYNVQPPLELSSAVKSMDGEIIDRESIHVTYSFDKDDKEVRTLFRTLQGDKLIDFCNAKVTEMKFCHQSGFLLKFIPQNSDEWLKIVKESIL